MAGTASDSDTGAFEFEKVSVADARKALEDGGPTGHVVVRPKSAGWDKKRQAGGDEPLSVEATAWLAALPVAVRPKQLALRYPRLANRISETWRAPHRSLRLLDQLMTDERGGRHGFPLPVATELATLRDYCYRLHRRGGEAWEHVEMGR
ncbi:MAG: hypothetical protein ACREX6_10890 [Casimicrobiaceae bacterium]